MLQMCPGGLWFYGNAIQRSSAFFRYYYGYCKSSNAYRKCWRESTLTVLVDASDIDGIIVSNPNAPAPFLVPFARLPLVRALKLRARDPPAPCLYQALLEVSRPAPSVEEWHPVSVREEVPSQPHELALHTEHATGARVPARCGPRDVADALSERDGARLVRLGAVHDHLRAEAGRVRHARRDARAHLVPVAGPGEERGARP